MKKIKVGIIGVGYIAQVGYIPALRRIGELELFSLCDTDEPKLYKAQDIHKVSKVYTDFEGLLEDKDVDAVIISTPNHLHTPLAMAALEYGKNVLLEKPMSLNLMESELLSEKVKERKNVFLLGLNQRFRPDVLKMKDILSQNTIGKIYYIECGYQKKRVEFEKVLWKEDRESGGGALNLYGIHLLELLFFLFPQKPSHLVSSLFYENKDKAEKEVYSFFKIGEIGVRFEVSWNPLLKRDKLFFNIHGDKGVIYLNPFQVIEKRYGSILDVRPEVGEEESFFKISFQNELTHWAKCIQGKEKAKYGVEEGIFLTEVIEKIKSSA